VTICTLAREGEHMVNLTGTIQTSPNFQLVATMIEMFRSGRDAHHLFSGVYGQSTLRVGFDGLARNSVA